MNFKSKAVGVAFRVLASVSVVGSTTLLAGTAMAALTAADQTAVSPLADSISAAVKAAVAATKAANPDADDSTIQAAVEAAILQAIGSADPEVANLALAQVVITLTDDGTMDAVGVKRAFDVEQQAVLERAIIEAVGEANAAGGDVELAILETIDGSGVSQAVAQAALSSAKTALAASGTITQAQADQIDGLVETVGGDREATTGAGQVQIGGALDGSSNYNA